MDLVVEVKDWNQTISQEALEAFARTKEALEKVLERPTAFLFHAEKSLSESQGRYLAEQGILWSDGESLKKADETA